VRYSVPCIWPQFEFSLFRGQSPTPQPREQERLASRNVPHHWRSGNGECGLRPNSLAHSWLRAAYAAGSSCAIYFG
jgi:hypothetical protein